MKHFFILFESVLLATNICYAQPQIKTIPHIIEVARFSNYYSEYLTVVNNHVVSYNERDISGNWEQQTYALTYTFANNNSMGLWYPSWKDVITEINGKSTSGMTPDEFYSIIDNTEQFSLTNINHETGLFQVNYNVDFENWIPKNAWGISGNPELFPPSSTFLGGLSGHTRKIEREYYFKQVGINCTESIDKSFDFGKCKSYDFLIQSRDPEEDTKILERIPFITDMNLVRDFNNPDIVFYLKKEVIKRPQMMLSLELYAIDAKKSNYTTTPPVVWKMVTSRAFDSSTQNALEEFLSFASWACIPPLDRVVSVTRGFIKSSGIIQDTDNTAVINQVVSNSRAEKAGFLAGDTILKAVASRVYKDNNFVQKTQKIVITDFPKGFFDSTFPIAAADESCPFYWPNGSQWINSERDYMKGAYPELFYGYYNANLEWEVTVKRGGRKIKLSLPSAKVDGQRIVSTYYMLP